MQPYYRLDGAGIRERYRSDPSFYRVCPGELVIMRQRILKSML